MLLAYVDDLLLLGHRQRISEVIRVLSKQFKMTRASINEETDFLRTWIKKESNSAFSLSQSSCCTSIIVKFYRDVEECATPVPIQYDAMQCVDSSPSISP